MQNIENVYLAQQLLLVENNHRTTSGLLKVKVLKTAENSKYKVGQEVLIEPNRLIQLEIDGEIYENLYHFNEEFIKGYVKV